MFETILYVVLASVTFVLAAFAAIKIGARIKKARVARVEFAREAAEFRAHRDRELAAWKERVLKSARDLVAWDNPEGKETMFERLFGDERADYLWYYLAQAQPGDIQRLFPGGWNFGDVEVHGNLLRLRRPMFRAQLDLGGGRFAPLVQIGHADIWGEPEVGCVDLRDPALYQGKA